MMQQRLNDQHIRANFRFLRSCYLTGSVSLPDSEAEYFFAGIIKSTNWNKAVFADPLNLRHRDFVLKEAQKRGIAAAFFVREADIDLVARTLDKNVEIELERWMLVEKHQLRRPAIHSIPGLRVKFNYDCRPNSDYESVLGNLFIEERINNIFRDYFIPTLHSAELGIGVSSVHAVAYLGEVPVSCGSTYRGSGLAGLYNVGTVAGFQGKGFGTFLSYALTEETFRLGAHEVFLQCVIGTHVERVYESIGFMSVEMPGIAVLSGSVAQIS